jgi:hypothetical protein
LEGIFLLPLPYVSADLRWTLKKVNKAIAFLTAEGFLRFDAQTNTLLLRNALRYQTPENSNQATSCIRRVAALPNSELLFEFLDLAKKNCLRAGASDYARTFYRMLVQQLPQIPQQLQHSLVQQLPQQLDEQSVQPLPQQLDEQSVQPLRPLNLNLEPIPISSILNLELRRTGDGDAVGVSLGSGKTDWEKDCEKFWSVFPNQKQKGLVEAWFREHKPSPDLIEKILAAIAKFKTTAEWQRDGGRYVPNPRKWLDLKSWLDTPKSISYRPTKVVI